MTHPRGFFFLKNEKICQFIIWLGRPSKKKTNDLAKNFDFIENSLKTQKKNFALNILDFFFMVSEIFKNKFEGRRMNDIRDWFF